MQGGSFLIPNSQLTMWHRISQFIRVDLWRKTGEELGRWHRIGYLILRSIVLTIRGFLSHDINTRANALTYSMMFAIVPMLSLVLAIAKGFGFEQVIETKLYDSFLGQMNIVPTIMGFVHRYLETAQGGTFIGVGLLVLLWSVYSFFNTIESSFNRIWQVQKSRSMLRQFTTYITILLVVPILMVVSSGIGIFFHSATADVALFDAMAPVQRFLVRLLPLGMCWLIFSWMYWAIPNTRVGAWAALVPGLVVGTLFRLLQMLSFYLVAFLSRTSIVYGAFAAVPLLLTWLQLSCLFMLSGAELSFAIENHEDFDYERDLLHISRRYKDIVTLFLTYVVIKRFEHGEPPQTAVEIASEHHLPIRLVNQLLSRLTEIHMLQETYAEQDDRRCYLPTMDIHTLNIGMVIDRIDNQGNTLFLQSTTETFNAFCQRYDHLKDTQTDMHSILLMDM